MADGRPGGSGCWKLGGPSRWRGTRLPGSTHPLAFIWVPGTAWTSEATLSRATKSPSVTPHTVGPDEGAGTDTAVHFSTLTPTCWGPDNTAKRRCPRRCVLGRGGRRMAADGCVSMAGHGAPQMGCRGDPASGSSFTRYLPFTARLNNLWMEATLEHKQQNWSQATRRRCQGRRPGALQSGLLRAPPPAAGQGKWPPECCVRRRRRGGEARTATPPRARRPSPPAGFGQNLPPKPLSAL